MSDEATSKFGKTWLYVAGMFALLPLLYALSVGPATVLYMRNPSRSNTHLFADTYGLLFSFAEVTGTDGIVRIYQIGWLRMAGIDPAVFY